MATIRPNTVDGSCSPSGFATRGPRGVFVSYKSIGFVVGGTECLVIWLGSVAGQYGYAAMSDNATTEWGTPLGVGLLSSLLYVSACRTASLYTIPSLLYPIKRLSRVAVICAFVLLSLTATLFLLKIGSSVSRGSLLGFAAVMLVLCCLTRIGAANIIDRMMRRGAIIGRAAFLIGEADELEALSAPYLMRHFGLREAGRSIVGRSAELDGDAFQRAIQEALVQARARQAKEFIVATRWDTLDDLARLEAALRVSPLPVRLIPHKGLRSIIGRHAPAVSANSYVVDLQRPPMRLQEQVAKRVLDLVGASVGIVLLMPVFILAACAVKFDSDGPVVFRQRRNGFDQRQFVIFKFRTMRVLEDGATVTQARRNDSRITPVGRLLRRSSIDELPQLFNVLRGEMSLVGPRPHALAHDQQYTSLIDDYCMRHHVKPGITGWAQIKGCRGETVRPEDMQRRVEYDLWYIQNWRFTLDLQILLRTCLGVVTHDAY